MVRDGAYAALSLVAPAAAHFLLRLYVGRSLGEEALGLYALTWAIYGVALILGTLGAGPALTRYTAQLRTSAVRRSHVLSAGLAQAFAGGTIAAVLLAAASGTLGTRLFELESLSSYLVLAAIVLPGAAAGKAVAGYLNGQRRMGEFVALACAQGAAAAVLTFLLVSLGHGTAGAVLGSLLPAGALGLASLALVSADLRRSFAQSQAVRFSAALLRFGRYATMTNGVGVIQGYTDTLMLGAMLSGRDVGLYAAALLALQAVRLPGTAAQLAVNPRIAAMWPRGDIQAIGRTINLAMGLVAALVLPAGFACMVGGHVLLREAIGESFVAAAPALSLLMPGGMVAGLWAVAGTLLSSTGHQRIAFRVALLSVSANIPLNFVLIQFAGLTGAALATSLSLGLGCVFEGCLAQRHSGVQLRWQRIALIGTVLTAAAWLLPQLGARPESLMAVMAWWLMATTLCAFTVVDNTTQRALAARLHLRRAPR
jgi:O-antigen/teichoic acid export membrane protein